MRRLLRKLTFVPVMLILAGFVLFTLFIAKPLRGSEKRGLVEGTLNVAPELKPDAPFIRYVALYAGDVKPADALPDFPVNDVQTEDDGAFELTPDLEDGTRFFLLARIETAKLERFCKEVALPPVRRLDDRNWVDAKTGKPLPPLRITVDKSEPCD
jgi:hypothetical protein